MARDAASGVGGAENRMSLEHNWRDKSNAEVEAAVRHLADYTNDAQVVIRAELRRRGLIEPPGSAGDARGEQSEPASAWRDLARILGLLYAVGAFLALLAAIWIEVRYELAHGFTISSPLYGILLVAVWPLPLLLYLGVGQSESPSRLLALLLMLLSLGWIVIGWWQVVARARSWRVQRLARCLPDTVDPRGPKGK